MKKNKASLKDIATEVGVSIATVSYVLTEKKGKKISKETSDKIREVTKKLNYQPNIIAQSLKSGRTNTIGLIVADISNPFFASIARIVEEEATKLNYTVIFGSSNEDAVKSKHLIDFLSSRQVDGFIISPSYNSENQIKDLKEKNVPFVLIDRYFPDIETNYVIIDNFKASQSLVESLVASGNKKIGIIVYSNFLFHMKERVEGYNSVLQKYKLDENKNWLHEVNFNNSCKEVRLAIDKMLSSKNKVDAIVFATNSLAIHGLKYLDELNLKVPDDIAIASFDEGEAFDFYYCPLAHIKQPLEAIAKNAVETLIYQINNPKAANKKHRLDAAFIVGESSGKIK